MKLLNSKPIILDNFTNKERENLWCYTSFLTMCEIGDRTFDLEVDSIYLMLLYSF